MIPENDPRLTAYALGELPEAERHAFEALLADDPAAEREVAEIRALASQMQLELADLAPEALSAEQRDRVKLALDGPADLPAREGSGTAPEPTKLATVTKLAPRRARRWLLLAAPATIVAAAGALLMVRAGGSPSAEHAPSVAGSSQPWSDEYGWDSKSKSPAPPVAAATAAPMSEPDARRWDKQAGDQDALSARGNLWGTPGLIEPRPMASATVTQDAAPFSDNPFVMTARDPRSTFSVDVDTASYSMIRRSLEEGRLPDPSFVRIEEMVNYFSYAYAEPNDEAFGVTVDAAGAPWAPSHRLVRVGLKGRSVEMAKRPASNLVFLLDVSGSMSGADRLPLLKQSLSMLVDQLDERDRVSIVVYAGASGVVLEPTAGNRRDAIRSALDRLQAGGSTNGGQGIELAYAMASRGFVEGGINRVILATDGDFNVGVTSRDDLVRMVEQKAKAGTFLTVLGFGSGNFRDGTMESLADKGNGNYAYVDSLAEAKKVLVEQASGTLNTIAKDVKIQISFDPDTVQSFRLIGYENRVLAHQDFTDDRKDAGEIGAGHRVTALYEIVPTRDVTPGTQLGEIALRYKMPDGATSRLVEARVVDGGARFDDATTDFRFAAGVAGFGMVLRRSPHRGDLDLAAVKRIASGAIGDDPDGYRRGFVSLVDRASALAGR